MADPQEVLLATLDEITHFASIGSIAQVAVKDAAALIRALQADAKRYRWLRKATPEQWDRMAHYTSLALDDVIDAALRDSEQEGKNG